MILILHPEEGVAAGGGGTGAVDDELLHILKDLRKKMAKKLKSSSFCHISGSISGRYGHSVSGEDGGATKYCRCWNRESKKIRKEFVEVIQEYVEEKDILRPQDMVVKSVVNKSGVKVYIIQSIDRKLPLDDIATCKKS